mmetsp:Transcript_67480/g.161932  ORF Transcript_67480/g.161932 Transcript_67480/m.161932 type:complete len:255 (+) Transcript_67480:49-813(+)
MAQCMISVALLFQCLLLSCCGIASVKADDEPAAFDNSDVPSWVPGYPGIDKGTILFTYKKDTIEIIILVTLGIIYKMLITNARTAAPIPSPDALPAPLTQRVPPHDFRAGRFSCFNEMPVCLWSFLSTHTRMGDTYHASQVTNFWMPTLVFILSRIIANIMGLVTGMPAGLPTFSMLLLQACFFVRWRQALRTRLGSAAPQQRLLQDLLFWTCCQPCAAAQEAQDLDAAQGVRVGYCLTVTLVGEPLAAQLDGR